MVTCGGHCQGRSHTPSHLGYRRLEKEESRVFDPRTHELRESACAKAQLGSYGGVRLAPGVKLCRVGLHKGPMDSIQGGFQQEPEEPFRLRRTSIQRPGGQWTLLR
jgi:hypothetical protein